MKFKNAEYLNLQLNSYSLQFPSSDHQVDEVVIVVNWGWNGSVVVIPLGFCDLAIAVFVTEASQKFCEYFLLSHFSWLHFRVEAAVVHGGQVGSGNSFTIIMIEFLEGSFNNV
jgi:hypothetical protein